MHNILSEFVCPNPFTYLEIHENEVFGCCPSWLTIPYGKTDDLRNVWNNDTIDLVRKSVLDGSYSYCSKSECPYLSQFINDGRTISFTKRNNIVINSTGPTTINFAFDRSCNLSCPSCRKEMFMPSISEVDRYEKKMNDVIEVFGKSLTSIYLSGSADPFASEMIRNFLINFDRTRIPNVTNIHLHTNGQLFTPTMWKRLSHIHDLIRTLEISVDAATKETYELIRRGGRWEKLVENMEFISTLNKIDVRLSFVVQDTNYFEMDLFNVMTKRIFGGRATTYFNKILNNGTYTDIEYERKQIWNEHHPDFNKFLIELAKIDRVHNCRHNMYNIINKHIQKTLTRLI